MEAKLYIHNADQIITITSSGEQYKTGESQNNIDIITNGSVVVGLDGTILFVGDAESVASQVDGWTFEKTIDAAGMSVLPGFVDGHTHPVWSGDRVHEFAMKLAGASYVEIHKMGGGIGFTVRHTRESSEEELRELLVQRLDRMMKSGTTTAEAKSGYGLDLESEMKQLKVLHWGNENHDMDLVSNYLAAHSVPPGMTAGEATDDIVNNQIPELVKLRDAGLISPSLVDVFCDEGFFEIEDTKRILEAGVAAGLDINFHGDEIKPLNACKLAGDMKALAVSHCERCSIEAIESMTARPTAAVLLPTTFFLMKLEKPPVREMIEGNVPVALGTDFNPNCHCLSMPYTMNLACIVYGLTMKEALVAATLNSAYSIGKSDICGSIEVGKLGDFVILSESSWEHVIYEMGDPPIHMVIKKGNVVHE
eukprot:TRINITY_DN3842_c0_g1_i1.p1 TRINITY_DN3842_c0_g1~~TRINITY_DN3842_c0_g1_i1.p1  ORF type:complete len:422 (+),score=101.73 TRINITY_DN3842_c0_g1_i1:1-1266(+)